jgi:hypothetical protein
MTVHLNPPRLLQTIPGDARYGVDGGHCLRQGLFLAMALQHTACVEHSFRVRSGWSGCGRRYPIAILLRHRAMSLLTPWLRRISSSVSGVASIKDQTSKIVSDLVRIDFRIVGKYKDQRLLGREKAEMAAKAHDPSRMLDSESSIRLVQEQTIAVTPVSALT